MSLYISICESYSAQKLKSLDAVVETCKGYYLQDGRIVTRKLAQELLKDHSFNVYSYDEDELAEARENGYVMGADWALKIQKL